MGFHLCLFIFQSGLRYLFMPPLKKKTLSVGQSFCKPSDVCSLSFDPFAWKLPGVFVMLSAQYLDPFAWKWPNLVQLMSLGSRWLLLILRSHGQRSRSNCWSLTKCFLSWSLCLKVAIFGKIDVPRKYMTPIGFEVTCSKVKIKLQVYDKILSAQYLLTPLLESDQTWYSGCP